MQESFNRNLVYFATSATTIKTEFTYFPFTQVEKPKTLSGLAVDSLTDLAVNKFFTIYQKPSAWHFIDLYLIMATKICTWEQTEKLARIKFETKSTQKENGVAILWEKPGRLKIELGLLVKLRKMPTLR